MGTSSLTTDVSSLCEIFFFFITGSGWNTCDKRRTFGWDISVEIETVFSLMLDKWSHVDATMTTSVRVARRRRWRLWTDRSVSQSHADSVPVLGRPGRRHEAQLSVEQRRVLKSEKGVDGRQAPVGQRHADATQLAVLRVDHPRAHLRRQDGAADPNRQRADHQRRHGHQRPPTAPRHRRT